MPTTTSAASYPVRLSAKAALAWGALGLLLGATAQPGPATAVDTGLTGGKKVKLQNKDGVAADQVLVKIVKDMALQGELPSPLCPAASAVRLRTDTHEIVVPLDCAKWAAAGKGYKYVDKTGAAGGVQKVQIASSARGGKLQIQLKGPNYGAGAFAGPAAFVEAELGIGADHWCGRFASATFTKNDAAKLIGQGPSTTCDWPTPTATATSPAADTATVTATPTLTETPTATASETATNEPTLTPTVTPTQTSPPTETATCGSEPPVVHVVVNPGTDTEEETVLPPLAGGCLPQNPSGGGCTLISGLDGSAEIVNVFDASGSFDPRACANTQAVSFRWEILFPPTLEGSLYSCAGISGYLSDTLTIQPSSLPSLEDTAAGSDTFWRARLTVTSLSPPVTERVVYFRFQYQSSELTLQMSDDCRFTGFFNGVPCSIIAPNALPTTEPH